jgi:hypothetical protein
MIFSSSKARPPWPSLLVAAAIIPAACSGGDDDGPEVGGELEQRDAAAGAAGGGGLAGSGGMGAATGAGGTGGVDSGSVDPGPCGKEFEPCCGGAASCEGADLSCSDSACVACGRVPTKTGCTNVAPRGTATAIVTRAPDDEAPDYSPRLAIDGNVCNVWASGNYAVDPEAGLASTWWEVDLGTPLVLSAMTLWLAMTPPGSVDLRVEHSADHAAWQPLFSGSRAMSGSAPWLHDFPEPVSARYVRVWFNASPSWISIRELALSQCP